MYQGWCEFHYIMSNAPQIKALCPDMRHNCFLIKLTIIKNVLKVGTGSNGVRSVTVYCTGVRGCQACCAKIFT